MKKLLLILLFIIPIVIYAIDNTKNESDILVGGWYPLFFSRYNNDEIQQLVNQIINGKTYKIKISYDRNKNLAQKILRSLLVKTNFNIEMESVHINDGIVKYNHDIVVVTVYTK